MLWIDDPHVRHTELAIVPEPALIAVHAVLRREDLNDDHWRPSQNRFIRFVDPEHRNVCHSHLLRRDFDSDLRIGFQLAFFFVRGKPPHKECLDRGVLFLTRVALLQLTGEIITVRPIAGSKILIQ
jgi:hypothetical protein